MGFLLLVGVILRASFQSYDPEVIAAVGTLLAGLAAIMAVFTGFITMRQQVTKTTRAEWLKMFRIEAANVMVLSQGLASNSTKAENMEYTRAATILTLMLTSGVQSHDELKTTINKFTIFLMGNDQNNAEYHRHLTHNWQVTKEKIEAVIKYEEKKI